MMFYTHAAFALLLGLVSIIFLNIEFPLLFAAIVLVSSLLPDIDDPRSYIGRRAKILSYPFKLLLGHRKLFHSLFIPFTIGIALFFILNIEVALAFFIGYSSHILSDGLTKAGVQPLYPLRFKMRGPFQTNSFLEFIVFSFLVGLILFISIIYIL